jgi:hypothetical protein
VAGLGSGSIDRINRLESLCFCFWWVTVLRSSCLVDQAARPSRAPSLGSGGCFRSSKSSNKHTTPQAKESEKQSLLQQPVVSHRIMPRVKAKEPDRVLICGRPDFDRCDNKVTTARYTALTFLPVVFGYTACACLAACVDGCLLGLAWSFALLVFVRVDVTHSVGAASQLIRTPYPLDIFSPTLLFI